MLAIGELTSKLYHDEVIMLNNIVVNLRVATRP